MPINMKWIILGRVAYFELYGPANIEEAKKVNDFMLEGITVSNSNELFHMIIDSRHLEVVVSKIPEAIKTLITEDYSPVRKHPNMGWTILISDNKMLQYLTFMVTQMTKNRFRIMPDLKSCLEFLKEQDQNLDWASVNIDVIDS